MNTIKQQLNDQYNILFTELNIDSKTGIVNNSQQRFASKACIGENYINAKKKILFISLDMGKDENYKGNNFQNFDERRVNVCDEDLNNKNPHMAGVYGTALYFLQKEYNWEKQWELLKSGNMYFKQAIVLHKNELTKDVLSYISLINMFNFVTIGRGFDVDKDNKIKGRAGANDRVFIDVKKELKLLQATIDILKPDVIVVQSLSLRNYFKQLSLDGIDVFVGFHPSVFGRNIKYRLPNKYIEHLTTKR